jgi:quercetin dioxygenase-like cupin family protein
MATSPNSFVAVFQVAPRRGEPSLHQHPDSDQILYLLKGEMTVATDEEGKSEKTLSPGQGVMIPAGAHYGFVNRGEDNMVFLSMRTESSGGRYTAYVENVDSDAQIRFPAADIAGRGVGKRIYLYALSRRTIGVSPVLHRDWHATSLVRMHCSFEQRGDDIVATLPERLARWYEVDDLTPADYRVIPDTEDKTRLKIDLSPLLERQAARA